jgi:DNA-directed RNA polymerase subunit N (RpoN/RPB10)
MLMPILCFTCGMPIGDKADLFKRLRSEKAKAILAQRGTIPTKASVDPGLQIDCTDIFDRLKIFQYCCRMHLTSNMEFADLY